MAYSFERGTNLCKPFLRVIPVTGAAVSVLAGPGGQSTISASDSTAERLDELQFDLGIGPCWDAMTTRRPVLEPDVHRPENTPWPMFVTALQESPTSRDVAAMFAFPLSVGRLDIGAVDLYSSRVGPLNAGYITSAIALAEVASRQVLRGLIAEHPDASELSKFSRREVHQATGMILAQLNISADDAALMLRAHAFATGRSVLKVANDVVERRLDFSDSGEDKGSAT